MALAAFFLALIAAPAFPQHPIPESERWATITHPGNEPFLADTTGPDPPRFIGQVNYEYQISRTEVTGGEWFEFVQAYAPYVDDLFSNSPVFTSIYIVETSPDQYFLAPAGQGRPVEIGWRFAARYVNWLHNGKASNREAFEEGAYDTSTFGGTFPDGFTDQQAHSPGARYWIPTEDEWVKAAHFDPNKNGPGMPGYWIHPTSTDTFVTPGPPELGGETSAGYQWALNLTPEVAAYRHIQSPWGLWDASGGAQEWLETLGETDRPLPRYRTLRGSSLHFSSPFGAEFMERIENREIVLPTDLHGLRVARAVPGVWSAGVFMCALSVFTSNRRRQHEDSLPNLCVRHRLHPRDVRAR